MRYVDGMLCAVPTANKQRYLEHAEQTAAVFLRYGALSLRECWGDDVPEGATNSMPGAVLQQPDETVVFSWIVWPSKAVRDEAWAKLHEDEAMRASEMPFDGKRMIFGGFESILER
ncbi:MAG: DUF1428 domain-containing protein [Myxococcota bacterium]